MLRAGPAGTEHDAECLSRELSVWQQHEVATVVEPSFPEDALDVSCGRCRGDLKDLGYFPVGNEAPADQVENLSSRDVSPACLAQASEGSRSVKRSTIACARPRGTASGWPARCRADWKIMPR